MNPVKINLDEGYQFGLGVFETIGIEQGQPILLSFHLERLRNSLNCLGISGTVSESEVFRYLSDQEKLRGKPLEHQALKIMVSDQNCLFTLRPNPYTPQRIAQGFRLGLSDVYRNETSLLTYHKTLNYGDCILEKRHARTLGIDELIFCNSRGEICEGTTTNIFFVSRGKLLTPPLSCGLLPGVLRRFLMENMPVEERVLCADEISEMDECFVTNSLMGVMPVTCLGTALWPIGPVTHACRELYIERFHLPY